MKSQVKINSTLAVLALLALQSSKAPAAPLAFAKLETAKIFRLQAFSRERKLLTSCTATMVRDQVGCHLITNYHCVREGASLYEISGEPAQADSQQIRPYLQDALLSIPLRPTEVKPIKQDPGADLAELSIPDTETLRASCSGLSDSFHYLKNLGLDHLDPVNDLPRYHSAESIGYAKTGVQIFRSGEGFQGSDWAGNLDSAGVFDPALSDRHYLFFELGGLQVKKGMSGGIVIDQNRYWPADPLTHINFSGIITRLIDKQATSYIIPARQVWRFLQSPNSISGETAAQKRLYSRLSQCSEAGDNEHGVGGDNEHAAGGESCPESIGYKAGQLIFHMLEQGYLMEDGHTRLLAINGIPINGYDDYRNVENFLKSANPDFRETFKTREETGYLDRSDRLTVLDRLSGDHGCGRGDDGTFSTGYKIFSIEDSGDLVERQFIPASILVHLHKKQSGQYQLEFEGGVGKMVACESNRPCDYLPAFRDYPPFPPDIIGNLSFNEDAKDISLVFNNGTKLTCDNRSYQQIICTGPTMSLSIGIVFSDLRSNGKAIEIQFVYLNSNEINGKKVPLVHYYYGKGLIDGP